MKEAKKHCRQLAKKFHPDLVEDEDVRLEEQIDGTD